MSSENPRPTTALPPTFAGQNLRRAGLIAGPLLALLCYALLPVEFFGLDGRPVLFSPAGRATTAMLCWMALWWMTEAVPIEVTSLLPVAVFPLVGAATLPQASAPYASDVIFLFLGGFILAAAIQRWGLDRRIAFHILTRVGAGARRIVAGVMIATAFMSLWVSNTATAAMMVPIARAIVDLDGEASDDAARRERLRLGRALMLGIAYAASIGGIGTIIGSPPNGILVRFVEQTYAREISFAQWMAIGMPIVLILLPLTWWLLTRALPQGAHDAPAGGTTLFATQLRALGPLRAGERATLCVFIFTAMLWIGRPWLVGLEWAGHRPLAGLSDAGIALSAALALFLWPVGDAEHRFAMDWKTAERLPWGVLILFGGGLSLAAAMEANGVAQFIGAQVRDLAGWHALAVLAAVIALTVFLSEVMSNTAQVATMIPLLAALAPALGLDPMPLIVAATLGASCAFMLPAGTPPNAIVFSTGYLTIPQMCRSGLRLNLMAVGVITLMSWLWVPWVLERG